MAVQSSGEKERIRIILKAYDHKLIDKATKEIVELRNALVRALMVLYLCQPRRSGSPF